MPATIPAAPQHPLVVLPGTARIAAAGASLVVREWHDSGPSYLHVHRSDDEAWHVLDGLLRFRFLDGEVDAPPGTTVFVPAGLAHTYRVVGPSRYLIVLTPRLDRLIARLRELTDASQTRAVLEAFDTAMVDEAALRPPALAPLPR